MRQGEGLSGEDEIIAIDGHKADFESAESKLTELKPGETVKITVFHNNIMKEVTLWQNTDTLSYRVEKISNANDLQKSIFKKWLGVK